MKLLLATAAFVLAGTLGQPAVSASASVAAPVHFATPLAATRYFAAAASSGDVPALHQVTTPGAFKAVMLMRPRVRDLRAVSCTATGRGDYNCMLSYRFPHQPGTGQWHVIVAPAISPGWYVYQYAYQGCG
jgi:hypothetical protein